MQKKLNLLDLLPNKEIFRSLRTLSQAPTPQKNHNQLLPKELKELK
jgi:hypothetical protein